jgi:hypothetical protein
VHRVLVLLGPAVGRRRRMPNWLCPEPHDCMRFMLVGERETERFREPLQRGCRCAPTKRTPCAPY